MMQNWLAAANYFLPGPLVEPRRGSCITSEEPRIVRGDVCQAPSADHLGSDHDPDVVNPLLPGLRHDVVDLSYQFGQALEFDFFCGTTNQNAPSRVADPIYVINLKGDSLFMQAAHLRTCLRAEDNGIPSDGIVDRDCGWSQFVLIDEATDDLFSEQREALVP